jgi:serine protease
MKKINLLIAALLVLSMTSMIPDEKDDIQQTKSLTMEKSKPMFQKGMITIKVKEGVGEFEKQRGEVIFNIPSLDVKVNKYDVNLLEKRFRYNPQKLRDGLPDLSRIYRIEFPEEHSVTKVAREFSKDPNIEYAEPIPVNQLLEVPNDPMYGQLHHLPQIFAEEAWEIHKGEDGEEEVVIAIVDTGTEWDHEDLVDNIWQNMGEDFDGDGKTLEFIGGEWIFDPDDENGLDDDENGYIDDFIGWNFALSNNDPNPIPGTYKWHHGTLMGGYASATTNNNIGVASISWNLKILPLQMGFLNYEQQNYNAIIYAAENGADVISNSWGSYEWYSLANHEAISYAIGLGSIIVGGTGNSNMFRNMYPASYPGVIAVAAVNHLDAKAYYSNFGPHIDISAPGGDGSGSNYQLLSTYVNNSYQSASGTSCATPIVAGLLGLVKSYHPEWTSDQVITQVLGTADTIDYLNPGYENLLGSGRINAYSALDSSGVTLQQEIALDLFYSSFQDFDGNQIPEPGDTISLSLKLRNYNYGVGADNATFTLSTDDSDITILDNTHTGDIPADNYFILVDAFEFVISEVANTHLVNFELITTADKEITWGDTISIDLLVAPTGILVFQGEGTGNTYSGDFINEFLVDQGFQVFYSSHFPSSLNGFDAVFLSYGNHGQTLADGTPVTMEMTQTMVEYLYEGGSIYIECGSFFSAQTYFNYPDQEEIMDLFGIDEAQYLTPINYLSLLSGFENSICYNLEFTGSTQSLFWYIDKMTPNENGIAAFEEQGYGTVAVQGEGEYGQKTFCFSYALAKLVDGVTPNTRDTLLQRILDFFDIDTVTNNQTINMSNGYQFISSRIIPENPDMIVVMADVLNDKLDFVRNSAGAMLRKIGPNWVNGIGDWIVDEGYLVKMFADDSFTINGTLVDPTTPIPVVTGYQFVSYFPENPIDALIAFETIIGDDLDFIRNSQGGMLRKIGPNWVNGIGDALTTEGYLVKMFSVGEIIYPASTKSSGKITAVPTHLTFEGGNAADPVYTIYIDGLEIGNEVAAYDRNKMIGSIKINSENVFGNELPIFNTLTNGQGYESGNPITLKVWSENSIFAADFTMESVYDSYVSGVYPDCDGKYSIVNITKGSIEKMEETIFVYPNPSEGIFNILLEGVKGDIQIKVLDLIGKEYSNFKLHGNTSTQLDLSELVTGIYFISFSCKDFSQVKKIVIQ